MINLYEHISQLATAHPTKPALVVCDKDGATVREVTYQELLQEIESVAAGLAQAGLGVGDRVAFAFDNPAEQLVSTWAAWASGVVAVPLDSKRDTKEMEEYKLRSSKAKTVLRTLPSGEGDVHWMPTLEHEALVLFTSGTTAHPKGAQLTLKNLVTNAEGIKEWLRVTADDRFMVVLPLHHINSTTFCLTTLLAGGTIVVPPNYSNAGFFAQAARTGATFTSVVMSIVFDQLNRKNEYAAAKPALKLSRIQIGSAPVVASAAQEFIDTFGIPLYQGYGQTETALRVTGVPMGLPSAVYAKEVQENSIGTPMSWAEVEIMDDSGSILGEGEEGELVVRGGAVMQGYIGGEEAFKNGYFLTGDIGLWRMVDGKRFFYLKGRKKEIIIKGGVNISPVAVENALKKVSVDIEQAYVVGKDDKRYGEQVAAVVCWKSGVDETVAMRQLKARLLLGTEYVSHYETPVYLAALPATQLPTTSTGKVQRTFLKTQITEWESLFDLFNTSTHRFVQVKSFTQLADASHALYNHCWQPLTMEREEYMTFLQKNITLAAIDSQGAIEGQISFAVKDGVPTCVSICSASYKPKPVPDVSVVPTQKQVEEYIRQELDPVLNFHIKLGAQFVEAISGGRPQDKSSLGYTALMRYAVPAQPVVDELASISKQLIQAVLLLAHDAEFTTVDALSRPGGLAAHSAVQSPQ